VLLRVLGGQFSLAVVDLAAGTGKLTRVLVDRFEHVIAVEPLDGMRSVLEDRQKATGAPLEVRAAMVISTPVCG